MSPLASAAEAPGLAAAKVGEKDDDARILYVFCNGAHDYRVTMELLGWGTY